MSGLSHFWFVSQFEERGGHRRCSLLVGVDRHTARLSGIVQGADENIDDSRGTAKRRGRIPRQNRRSGRELDTRVGIVECGHDRSRLPFRRFQHASRAGLSQCLQRGRCNERIAETHRLDERGLHHIGAELQTDMKRRTGTRRDRGTTSGHVQFVSHQRGPVQSVQIGAVRGKLKRLPRLLQSGAERSGLDRDRRHHDRASGLVPIPKLDLSVVVERPVTLATQLTAGGLGQLDRGSEL